MKGFESAVCHMSMGPILDHWIVHDHYHYARFFIADSGLSVNRSHLSLELECGLSWAKNLSVKTLLYYTFKTYRKNMNMSFCFSWNSVAD